MAKRDVDLTGVWWHGSELPEPLDVRQLFGNEHPLEVDIGSGKGLFVLNAAVLNPAVNYLAIEWAVKYAKLAASRAVRRGIPNVRFVSADVRPLILRMADSIAKAVHIYFPDPWWKKRHKNRRIFTPAFIDEVARLLLPDGQLFLATDVAEYYGVMRSIMEEKEAFQLETDQLPPLETDDPGSYRTHFERKYRLEGRPIYYACYRTTNR